MKKMISLLMSAILVLALVGCSAQDVKVSDNDGQVVANAEDTKSEATATEAETEEATTEANKKDADWWISMGVQVDDDKKTETTTEKPSTTEETTTEAKKPSTTESKKPATTENTTTQSTTEAPTQTHTHTWATRTVTDQDAWDEQVCTKEAWDEKVCTKEAWDEQVPRYEEKRVWVCCNCGEPMPDAGPCLNCGCYDAQDKYEDVLVGYDTVHHDAEYTTVHHDAEYTTKHHDAVTHTETYCTSCGATK